LLESVCSFTHPLLHIVCPVTHALQVPLWHVVPVVHILLHMPQLFESVCSFTQAPEQHVPPEHVAPLVTLVHAVVLALGWQLWQPLPGFAAPDA
jgi:hypothetical protein